MSDPLLPGPQQQVAALRHEIERLNHELSAVQTKARKDTADILVAAQHRVRSSLSVVRALLSRAVQPGTSVESYAAHLTGRVETLARVYGVLTRSPAGTIDLEEMVRDEVLAQGGLVAARIAVEGPPVELPGKAAEVLGLAIHELASNSVKFGAFAAETGRVTVRWSLGEGANGLRLSIDWTEIAAPAEHDGTGHGFGRELIEYGLPYQLGAETAFEHGPDGFTCSIRLTLDSTASASWAILSGAPPP